MTQRLSVRDVSVSAGLAVCLVVATVASARRAERAPVAVDSPNAANSVSPAGGAAKLVGTYGRHLGKKVVNLTVNPDTIVVISGPLTVRFSYKAVGIDGSIVMLELSGNDMDPVTAEARLHDGVLSIRASGEGAFLTGDWTAAAGAAATQPAAGASATRASEASPTTRPAATHPATTRPAART